MIKIAHRGNTIGSNPLENAPEYIDKSLPDISKLDLISSSAKEIFISQRNINKIKIFNCVFIIINFYKNLLSYSLACY